MKYDWKFKLECVVKYKEGVRSFLLAKEKNRCFLKHVRCWEKAYDDLSIDGLKHSSRNKEWTGEQRFDLVAKVLAGNSIAKIAKNAHMDCGQLCQWVKRIDNAILEIQTGTGSFKASDALDKEIHLDSLQDLLEGVQNENETLFDTTIILSVYDELGESKNKKAVKAKLRDMGFGYTEMLGRQNDAYVTSMLSSIDKVKISRGIQTSSIAACFPFVSNAIMDKGGLLIGENRLPVFLDFFKRDSEFVNSNMVIMGKPEWRMR